MPGYSTLNRFSVIQLHSEARKQRAHLKKISDMQSRSGLDNGAPCRLPHLHQNFIKQLNDKRQEINKENEIRSKKLLNIKTSNIIHPPPPLHPANQISRNHKIDLSPNNTEYLARIAKSKSKYNVHEWRKEYEQHNEYLRMIKDNKLFTPLDIGINRERIIKTNSLMNSKGTTPSSSTINVFHKNNKND